MRPVIVGLRGVDGLEPLDPSRGSGARLAEMCGLGREKFLARTDRVNLLHGGRSEAGPIDLQEAALNLLPVLRGRRVLALGRGVSEALGVGGPQMEWAVRTGEVGGFVGASMPHPSGLSRWWNSEQNRTYATQFMRDFLKPCIHVEGPDGAGKTTLVQRLSERSGLRVVPTDDPPSSWDECLRRIGLRVGTGIVCDRSSGLVSELVYGPVLRGQTITSEEEVWGYVRAVASAVTFVYCRPPLGDLQPTFRDSEDPTHVSKVRAGLSALTARYDEVFERIGREGCRVLHYDWRRDSVEDLISCAG